MSPHTFKIVLTVAFSIGIVTSILGQLVNVFAYKKGIRPKLVINTTWVVNSILIYGVWNWL